MENTLLSVPRNVLKYKKELEEGRISQTNFVFADVSGFTALTERLKETEGLAAAEKIAKAIDGVVKPVALEALKYRGNIIAIEGDALLASFEDLKDALNFSKNALNLFKNSEHNDLNLSLDIGLSRGEFYESVLGDNKRRAYFTAGTGIKQVYKIEKKANKNLVSDFQIKDISKDIGDNSFEINLENVEEVVPENNLVISLSNYLSSFLPSFSRKFLTNEISRPGIIFLDIPVYLKEKERLTSALNNSFLDITKKLENSQVGFIDKFKEYNSLFIIGAPYTSEDCENLSLEAICEIEMSLKNGFKKEGLEFKSKGMGINVGKVFLGSVCGRYTIMGDAVNTAARIKEKSVGEILVSDSIKNAVKSHTNLTETDIELRSKKEKVKVFKLESLMQKKSTDTYHLYSGIHNYIVETINLGYGKSNQGQIIEIIGKTGSGRDRLISGIVDDLKDKEVLEIDCSPVFSKIPYHLIFEIAKSKLGLKTETELYEKFKTKEVEILIPKITNLISKKPSIYSITKIENADSESLRVISRIKNKLEHNGVFVLASSTSDEDTIEKMPGSNAQSLIPLNKLKSKEFALVMAKAIHGTEKFETKGLEHIVNVAKGNPFFISEMVKSAKKENEELVIEKNISDKIEDTILINISRLEHELKEALKTISLLHLTSPFMDKLSFLIGLENNGEEKLNKLKLKGILDQNNNLSNPLLKQAINHLMPKEERIARFGSIARVAETSIADNYLKAHYFMNSIDQGSKETANSRKFIDYVGSYIQKSDISRVPVEMLEKATVVASNYKTTQEKRIYGELLLGKIRIMLANATNKKDYEEIYRKCSEACEIYEGEPDYYRALRSKGRAACFMGNNEEGIALLIKSENLALSENNLLEYAGTVLSHSYILSNRLNRPTEGLNLLLNTKQTLEDSMQSANWEEKIGYIVPGVYKSLSECYLKLGDLEEANNYIEKAITNAKTFSVWHILAYGFATKGEILAKKGMNLKAKEECEKALDVIEEYSLNIKSFETELKNFIRFLNQKIEN